MATAPTQRTYDVIPRKLHPSLHRPLFATGAAPTLATSNVDLRNRLPPVWDQGSLGACTAFASCAAYAFDDPALNPSKLFLYFVERKLDGTIASDSGSTLDTSVRALTTYGVCSENTFPYNPANFKETPAQFCFTEASTHKLLTAKNVRPTLDEMLACLESGFPFLFSIQIFPSFESSATAMSGYVPMPGPGEKPLGSHALLAAGFDLGSRCFLVRNSWGSLTWSPAMQGYCWIPFDYLTNPTLLTSDLWVLQKVSPDSNPPLPTGPGCCAVM